MDVTAWLKGLGLERYVDAFRENEVTGAVLRDLTAEDLRELGVVPVGHRRQLLAAISKLGAEAEPAPELSREYRSAAAPGQPTAAVSPAHPPERRQITVMFVDFVGSTELSTKVDPEDLGDFLGAYRGAVATQVERNGGFVAQLLGDGVLVYFGYPDAHEDDPERAVRTAISIVEAVDRLPPLADMRPQVRLGIATGLVVVGDLVDSGQAQEHGIIGETPNLASRLQSLAKPSGIVIAEATRRLIADQFECRDLEPVQLKGYSVPLRAFDVVHERQFVSRFEALRAGRTPLVGRTEELDLLLRRWAEARTGEGRVVLISGEPGIGKSRLIETLRERTGEEPRFCLQYFCSPHRSESVLQPVVAQLEHAAGFQRFDTPETKLDKLEAVLAASSSRVAEHAALLADFLMIPTAGRYPPLMLSVQRRKELVFEIFIAQLEGLVRKQPVLMIFEDLHWIDPTSHELLEMVVRRIETLPILLVVTYRPEFKPQWLGQAQVRLLTLSRFGQRETAAMLERVAVGRRLPPELIEQIIAHAEGVPLFVEELTKSVIESGVVREENSQYVLAGPLPAFAVPTSLQASLAARLERLAPVRRIAQIGAALGREFSYAVIRALAMLPEAELRLSLEKLVAAEIIYQRGWPPDSVYTFKHALVQDAAYETLLRSQRLQMHARITETLERQFPDFVTQHPDLMAHHATEAAMWTRAIEYRLESARKAFARSAATETLSHVQKAREMLGRLERSEVHSTLDYRSQLLHADALKLLNGWMAPDVFEMLSSLLVHPGRSSGSYDDFKVSCGLWSYHFLRSELEQALELGQRLAAQNTASDRLTMCRYFIGASQFFMGRFEDAKASLDRTIDDAPDRAIEEVDYTIGYRPSPVAMCWLAMLHAIRGELDRSRQIVLEAIQQGRRTVHPFTLTVCLANASRYYMVVGDVSRTASVAAEAFAIAKEQKFSYFSARCAQDLGWVVAMQGSADEGLESMDRAFSEAGSVGGRMYSGLILSKLAECSVKAGQLTRAREFAEAAISAIDRNGERSWEAEAWRVRGEVALLEPSCGDESSIGCFRQAIEIAERQGASFWRLKAALSLSRVHAARGEIAIAGKVLAPVSHVIAASLDQADVAAARLFASTLSQ